MSENTRYKPCNFGLTLHLQRMRNYYNPCFSRPASTDETTSRILPNTGTTRHPDRYRLAYSDSAVKAPVKQVSGQPINVIMCQSDNATFQFFTLT